MADLARMCIPLLVVMAGWPGVEGPGPHVVGGGEALPYQLLLADLITIQNQSDKCGQTLEDFFSLEFSLIWKNNPSVPKWENFRIILPKSLRICTESKLDSLSLTTPG